VVAVGLIAVVVALSACPRSPRRTSERAC
jgi:hypothetical protein